MRLILCDGYDDMSEEAAKLVASQVTLKPDSVLGLATGSTPVGMYQRLAGMKLDFSQVTTVNLDEYYPISPDNDQSYRYFMQENLFSKINVKPENIHIPSGQAEDVEAECKAYDKLVENIGGIDLQILGIGQNGHIGFNEPDEALVAGTHLTGLTANTIEANSRFFGKEEDVPKQALTMGIGTIFKARKIVLMASGANKYEAIKALIDGGITTAVPATMLKLHPDVVVICDKAAYSGK